MNSARRLPSKVRLAALTLLVVSLTPGAVSAHALGADCTLRNGRVVVEAYYSDETSARHATVRVLDAKEAVVAEGHTDEQGRWSFPAPPPGRYAVLVDAGAGHHTRVRVTVPPRGESASASANAAECDCCTEEKESAVAPAVHLSDGPSRAEFTQFPWLRTGLGLGIIAALGLCAWWVRHVRRRFSRPQPLSPNSPT